jgi:prefoldin subunit 5
MPISDSPQVAANKAFRNRIDELNAEIERLRAALTEARKYLYGIAAIQADKALNPNDH